MSEVGYFVEIQSWEVVNKIIALDFHFLVVKDLLHVSVHFHDIIMGGSFWWKQPQYHEAGKVLLVSHHIYALLRALQNFLFCRGLRRLHFLLFCHQLFLHFLLSLS